MHILNPSTSRTARMQPPLPSRPVLLLVLVVLAAATLSYSAHAFLVLPSPSPLQQRQQQRSMAVGRQQPQLGRRNPGIGSLTVAATASDNDWPSDSSDMEDTSDIDGEGTAAKVVDVEASKATMQVRGVCSLCVPGQIDRVLLVGWLVDRSTVS
jgi:hypothetical protein